MTIVAVIVIVAIAALAQTTPIKRLAADLGIRTSVQSFTDLYFAHPSDPANTTTPPGRSPVRDDLAFDIRNQQHRATSYSWTITFSPAGQTYSGTTRVPARATTTVLRRVTLPCTAAQRSTRSHPHRPVRLLARNVHVAITVASPSLSIGFWQPCYG